MQVVRTQEETDKRWDMHTDRQISAAKAAIAAITVLNSGSWLALLSQADKLIKLPNGGKVAPEILFYWSMGAAIGTATWLFVYLNTVAAKDHDMNRDSWFYGAFVTTTQVLGVACAGAAWVFFLLGALSLQLLSF